MRICQIKKKTNYICARLEVFTAMKVQVVVFWVVTCCLPEDGYPTASLYIVTTQRTVT
jgi:hypothetical protein